MATERELRHRDFLKTFAVFKDFHPNDLLILAHHLVERRFERNQVIFQEGDAGGSAYFIVFGKVVVLKKLPEGGYEHLALMQSGQLFGQVSLVDGQERSATCAGASRGLLLELTKEAFDAMFDQKLSFAFRFQEYLTKGIMRQLRHADGKISRLVKTVKAGRKNAEVADLFHQFKDAMASVHEMGIDLDEVDYVIPEGQKRDYGNQRKQAAQAIDRQAPAAPTSTVQTIDFGPDFAGLDELGDLGER